MCCLRIRHQSQQEMTHEIAVKILRFYNARTEFILPSLPVRNLNIRQLIENELGNASLILCEFPLIN